MPRLPAFCEACGSVFASPLRAEAPGDENAFDIPVPCPACGGSGRVPGELLAVAREAAGLFRDADPEQADAFLDLLEAPRGDGGEGGASGDDDPHEALLLAAARRAPGFVELARRLPADRPAVLTGLAGLLRRVRSASGRTPDDAAVAAVERLLEEEAVEPASEDVPEPLARARRRLDEAGRNDPCPCGSGDKYKDCHWIPDLRTTRS